MGVHRLVKNSAVHLDLVSLGGGCGCCFVFLFPSFQREAFLLFCAPFFCTGCHFGRGKKSTPKSVGNKKKMSLSLRATKFRCASICMHVRHKIATTYLFLCFLCLDLSGCQHLFKQNSLLGSFLSPLLVLDGQTWISCQGGCVGRGSGLSSVQFDVHPCVDTGFTCGMCLGILLQGGLLFGGHGSFRLGHAVGLLFCPGLRLCFHTETLLQFLLLQGMCFGHILSRLIERAVSFSFAVSLGVSLAVGFCASQGVNGVRGGEEEQEEEETNQSCGLEDHPFSCVIDYLC